MKVGTKSQQQQQQQQQQRQQQHLMLQSKDLMGRSNKSLVIVITSH